MKQLLIASAIALSACTTAEFYEQPKLAVYTKPDPAAAIMLQCDQLRITSPEAARLCYMRGIDRLKPDFVVPQAAPISILPYPYPPLAPGGYAAPRAYTFR